MRLNRFLALAISLLIFGLGWHIASRFMVAKAIASPHASKASIVKLMLRPSFQMATPHRSLLTEIKLDLFPSVEACSTPDCDGTEAKPSCDGCPQGYCYRPGCQISGCTAYYCAVTGNTHRLCAYGINSNPNDPCYGCETDHNISCKPIPP
jgi:hypothetical protein